MAGHSSPESGSPTLGPSLAFAPGLVSAPLMSCDRPLAIQPICPKPDCSWTQFRDDQRLGLPPAVAAWSAPSSCIQGPTYSQPQAADTALLPERPFRQATRDSYLVACM